MFVGRARPPDLPPAAAESGYSLIASAHLSVLNEVLAELWRVGTIPHELSADRTAQLITKERLQQTCTGVPADAVLGALRFTGAPVAVVGNASATMRFDVPWLLPVVASTPATFAGTVSVQVPLDFSIDSFGDEPQMRLSLAAIGGARVSLNPFTLVDIQPKSEADKNALNEWLSGRIQSALLFESFQEDGRLHISAIRAISKRYPNSELKVVQAGATTVRLSERDIVVVGLNVQHPHDPIFPGQLAAPKLLPVATHNLHTEVTQAFASDALSAVISSGDLAAFLNRVLARHSVVSLSPIRIDSGRIAFQNGRLLISLDCVAVDACVLHKDLAFTASLTGTPAVAGGQLTITTSELDFDLDNWDAVVCTLLGGLIGPFGIVITVVALSLIAAINPAVSNLDIPVSETSDPLPGSDKVVRAVLTQAEMASSGPLTADGQINLVADPLHVFAYLRVVTKMGPVISPVPGVTVDLFELDDPAPAGDDVAVVRTGNFDTISHGLETVEEISYSPSADQLLGTQTTDEDGRVTFVAESNTVAGTTTHHRVVTDISTDHRVSSTTFHNIIPEALPDLAVTITSSTGQTLATRRLVGLNVTNRRLGTFDHPILVRVVLPLPSVVDP
jgi:hypothetical protein